MTARVALVAVLYILDMLIGRVRVCDKTKGKVAKSHQ